MVQILSWGGGGGVETQKMRVFVIGMNIFMIWFISLELPLICRYARQNAFYVLLSAAYYSRVTISVTCGYYIQLIGLAWLYLTVKPLRHSTVMDR